VAPRWESQLTVEWRAPDGSVADGDRYRVVVEDRDGKVLLDERRTVVYQEYFPNGPRCGPRCLVAKVND
jgi:hypothetical protein